MTELSKQAQSVGDLVGRAVRLYRQNFLVIVQALLLPSAGATLGKVGLQWGIINLKEPMLFFTAVAFCAGGFALSVWFLWILTIKQVALVRLLNGNEPNFATAYKAVKKRGWALFLVFILTHVMVVVNVTIFVIELVFLAMIANVASVNGAVLFVLGLSGFVGLVAGALYITLVTFVQFAGIALGNKKFGDLIKEGFALISRDFGRSSFFSILLMIAVAVLLPPLSLPLMGLSLLDALKPHSAALAWLGVGKYSLITLVIAQAWESLVNMVIWPIMFFAYGFLYHDLKRRQHASDLLEDLEKLQYSRI